MRSIPAYAAALVLVAIPPWIDDAPSVLLLSIGTGIALVFGLRRPSPVIAAVGGALALAGYAQALRHVAGPPGLLDALAMGVALAVVVDAADIAAAFRGAALSPAAETMFTRRRFATALLGGAAVMALAAIGGLVDLGAPPAFRPVLVGAGAFLALAAAIVALGSRSGER